MKNWIKRLMLAAVVFLMSYSTYGQDGQHFSDKIMITYNDSMQIKILVPNYGDKRAYRSVKNAFLRFQALFSHLVGTLPDHPSYSIQYEYGKKITTSRMLRDDVYYIVEDSNLHVINFKSTLSITGENFRIEVEFTDIEQLKDPNIQHVINTSIDKLPRRTSLPATIRYEYKDGTLTKPADHFRKHGKSILNYGMSLGASFGFANGLLSYEINAGVGYMHKVKNINRSYYFIGVSGLGSYNQTKGTHEELGIIQLGMRIRTDNFLKNNWVGYEIGIPLMKNQKFFGDPIKWKFGVSAQLATNLWLKMDTFFMKGERSQYNYIGIGVNL